jgi:3,4-dihydroxy 2-butanone 4-phosphate synthase/GTP cyclohydrolase II
MCDGLIISTPGFHGGPSGLIKNAIDYVEELREDPRAYLDGRAVGCIVCAAGWQATTTTLVAIRSTIHALRGWPTPLGVAINSSRGTDSAPDPVTAAAQQLALLAQQVVDFARWRHAASQPAAFRGRCHGWAGEMRMRTGSIRLVDRGISLDGSIYELIPRVPEPIGGFARIEDALEDLTAGKMVVVVDDEDRENEGDLVMAAQFVTPEAINFMTRRAGGWICLALAPERCEELGLNLMAGRNDSLHRTPFTVTIEAREGVTTGISVYDQAQTMRTAIDPAKGRGDLISPGHVHPLKAQAGGVLKRAGHTEASVDLARLAALNPSAVICEIQNDDGTMARSHDLFAYCRKYGFKMVTIADLIAYRRRNEKLIQRVVTTKLPTQFGMFQVVGYQSLIDGKQHVALVKGDVAGAADVLVRVHSECLTGDVFHSLRCDCGQQLETALSLIDREGCGVLLYLSQEGRGIGLLNKLRAYKLQEEGLDTVDANLRLGLPADLRDYGIGAQILADLGLTSIQLLTNNPKKIHGLDGYGLTVTAQLPIEHRANPHNEAYLHAKKNRLGQTLRLPDGHGRSSRW